MEVLEDHEEGLQLALAEQEALDGVEGPPAALRRIEGLPLGVLDGHVQERQQGGQGRLEVPVQREELAGDLLPDLAVGLAVVHVEVGLEEIDDGQVAGRLAVGHGARLQDEPVLGAVGVGELVEQARLAHPGLADGRHELTVPGASLLEALAELLDLGVPADEAGEPAGRRGLQARSQRADPGELVDLDRGGQALHGHGAQWGHLHEAFGEREGVGRQEDRARIGELLHPRREVGGLADGRVVHAEVGPDRPNDHLAGIQAHAYADRDAVLSPDALGVPLHRLLHAERGVAGADGVVLVRQRRAEEGHDAIAHHLVHRPLVAVDGRHHVLDDGIEELARLLGVAIGEELHGALEVGEEDGDLLALAFQGGLRGEDLLGQVLGVYESGAGNLVVGVVRSGAAHWPQNLFSGGLAAPQDGQVEASGAAHSPQNFMPVAFSCWHRRHFMPSPSGESGRERSDGCRELSLAGGRGQGPSGSGSSIDLTTIRECSGHRR